MSYGFRISDQSGQLGWLRWRNTTPSSTLPNFLRQYQNGFWGRVSMGNWLTEEAYRELVQISEDLGFYDDGASSR